MPDEIWSGLDQLITRLEGMGEKATDNVSQAMEDILEAGLETMNGLTPVRTGDLLSHNHIEGSGLELSLVNDSDHASYVNYGTRKMAAQPFLDPPAVDEVARLMQTKLVEAIADL